MSGFDQQFDGDVAAELNRRGDALLAHGKAWNYDKYAYITVKSTGNSETVIKSEGGFTIGDGASHNQGPHIGLYTSEGGIRKFKPLLKSCKITNEGGGDYTDSYLYNIEFSFTVFTMADLNKAEASVMRVGGEIQLDFGWKGYASGVNTGTVTANVFNYDFSMNEDGSFDCSVKAMSAAGLWGGDDLAATAVTKDGAEEKEGNFLFDLECACRTAFGLDSDDGPDSVSDLGDNKLRVETGNVDGVGIDGTFGAAELIVEPGFFNDEETYLFFTTIGTLIRYINKIGDTEGNQYKISTDGALNTWPKITEIGSSDPKDCFLPGDQGSYGDPSDGGNAANFSKWGSTLLSNASGDDVTDIDKIAISFEYLTKTYTSMADATKSVGGFKNPVKIAEFLKTIFARIDVLTGGLITLAAIPMKGNQPLQPDNQKPPFDINIVNKKLASDGAAIEPYTFETLSKRSITKAVSLSSEFDSDYVLMATKSNIEKGTSNGQFLLSENGGPFPKNPNSGAITPSKKSAGKGLSDLLKLRNEIGDEGASPQKLTAYGDACRGFIQRDARKNEKLAKGRYSEIQYTLNLSVTIDGVWGIKFLSPIKIDRLPAVFQGPEVMFSVTAVNHEFDGQGGWDTSLETVMRI
jgi:hypothetical protein